MIRIFGEHLTILIQQTHDKESAFERDKIIIDINYKWKQKATWWTSHNFDSADTW